MELFLKSAETKLMQTLSGIRDEPSGWQAVHFHMSELLEQYKSEYQSRIAINLIHDLLKEYEGGVFLMQDQSIIVLGFGLEKPVREKLVFQLRYLYMDDPLAYSETGQENPAFSTAYDLKRHWRGFYELCSDRMTAMVRPYIAPDKELPAPKPPEPVKEPVKMRLSASKLAGIERDLERADLNRVLRRQPVCAVMPGQPVKRLFDELYIHIAHLRQMLRSDVDFLSNRWLFKYLTRILDERMIDLIRSHPGRYLDGPVSLNLNVETLLSSYFTDFDAAIQPSARVATVIEVPVMDVFADMAAFLLARAEVQKLGYRVCLDGLTTASFASINREKLGFDLVKVQWNADAESDLNTKENREMAQAVQAAGSNRVILCRCDNRAAVEYGQAIGISLFQGRYLDSVLNPTAKVEN